MQVYKSKQNLQHHISEVHEKSSEVVCPDSICGEVLSSHRVATAHLKLKHKGKPHIRCFALQCVYCGVLNQVRVGHDFKKLQFILI